MPALCVLFGLRGVIERELDVMECRDLIVFQDSNTMTVGSDGELDRFRLQVGQYCLEVGMHAVLTGAEIHRPYGQAFHDCLHLIQGETIRASWIAVAEGAGEITLVGKAEPERNTGIWCHHARSGRRRLRCDVVHAPSFTTGLRDVPGNACSGRLRQTPVACPACALAQKSARTHDLAEPSAASNPMACRLSAVNSRTLPPYRDSCPHSALRLCSVAAKSPRLVLRPLTPHLPGYAPIPRLC